MAPPALVFASNSDDPVAWRAALHRRMPELDVRVWPETGRAEDVVAALVWRHPDGALNAFPNLKLVINLGAGVDPIFADPHLPSTIPIVRLVDPELTRGMTEYVTLHVLAMHRRMPELAAAQRAASWHYIHPPDTRLARVGLMGLGNLGGWRHSAPFTQRTTSVILNAMTKLLEQALEAVRSLPVESQDEIARAMLRLAAREDEPEPIDPCDLLAVQQGLAEAGRGEFATDDQVKAAFDRFGR